MSFILILRGSVNSSSHGVIKDPNGRIDLESWKKTEASVGVRGGMSSVCDK